MKVLILLLIILNSIQCYPFDVGDYKENIHLHPNLDVELSFVNYE
jgi:hypothetical protein